jgi:hypothetical protein
MPRARRTPNAWSNTMRFMNFVRCPEDCGPPPPAFTEAMTRAAEEACRAGSLLDSGGLAPIARSTTVRLEGGKVSVTDGPYAEGKEVVGGYGVVGAQTEQEAIDRAVWLMEMHREHWPGWTGEVEVRRILGPEDFPAH